MSILAIGLVIIVVGILLGLANHYIEMDGKIKNILNAVVVIGLVLWVLVQFGARLPFNVPALT